MVLNDRRKVRELGELTGISKSAIHRTVDKGVVKIVKWNRRIVSKEVPSASKVMTKLYLQKGKTINGEYYAYLLQRLSEKIKEKRPDLAKKSAFSSGQCTNSQIHYCDGQNQ